MVYRDNNEVDSELLISLFRSIGDYMYCGDYKALIEDMQAGLEDARKRNKLELARVLERDIPVVKRLSDL